MLAQSSGFNVANMDKTADACQDFFQYANGNWLKTTEIPASESRWGTFNVLADNNNSILRQILEKAQKEKAAKGTDMQLIGDFYDSCMNMAAINAQGIKPLEPILRSIRSISTVEQLEKQIANMHNEGIPAVFGFGAAADLKDSNSVIASAGQGGISLPQP